MSSAHRGHSGTLADGGFIFAHAFSKAGTGEGNRWVEHWLLKLLPRRDTFYICSHFIDQSKPHSLTSKKVEDMHSHLVLRKRSRIILTRALVMTMWVISTLGKWWKVILFLNLDFQSFSPASPLLTGSGISCSKFSLHMKIYVVCIWMYAYIPFLVLK